MQPDWKDWFGTIGPNSAGASKRWWSSDFGGVDPESSHESGFESGWMAEYELGRGNVWTDDFTNLAFETKRKSD
jgi:hypothetical protein